LDIFFYLLTGMAVLTALFVGTSEFVFEKKKFKWYFYIPQAVINVALGIAAPYVILFMFENPGEAKGGVLAIIYLCGVLLNNLLFFFLFFKKENFSAKFYFTLAILCLFGVSFWVFEFGIL